MKKILFTFSIFLLFLHIGFAGNPVIQNISPLNSPIVEGQQVYFLSTVDYDGFSCQGTLILDFGPSATPNNMSFPLEVNSTNIFNMPIGPVVFDMPGASSISQFINGSCDITPSNPIMLPINIMADAPIPTLSQWGLIIVAFFLMIFGILTLRDNKLPKKKFI